MNKLILSPLNSKSYGFTEAATIKSDQLPKLKKASYKVYPNLQVNANEARVDFDNCGSFYVADGKNITYNFIKHPSSFTDYLHSFITGLILLQRGHLLLHGNSCIYEGKHIAFCGESGSGKSSLAAQFHRAGALFFCDEIICFHKKTTKTLPGYPFLRLWKNDIEHNKFDPLLISKLWDNEDKYKLDTSKQRCEIEKKLDTLFYLEIDATLSRPQIIEIKGIEKFNFFCLSHYHKPVVKGIDLEIDFTQKSLSILQNLRIFKLSRPPELDSRKECFYSLEKIISKVSL